MKVFELIEELKKLDPNLVVALETDHGQTPMNVTYVGEAQVEDKNQYMMDLVADEDANGRTDLDKIVVIQAY